MTPFHHCPTIKSPAYGPPVPGNLPIKTLAEANKLIVYQYTVTVMHNINSTKPVGMQSAKKDTKIDYTQCCQVNTQLKNFCKDKLRLFILTEILYW